LRDGSRLLRDTEEKSIAPLLSSKDNCRLPLRKEHNRKQADRGEAHCRGRSHPSPNTDQAEKIDLVTIAAGLSLQWHPNVVCCCNFGSSCFT
jgi:hypothetical protein